jgi:hypothetical protein
MRKFICAGILVFSIGVVTTAQSFVTHSFAGASHQGNNVQIKENTNSLGYSTVVGDPEESLILAQVKNACTQQCDREGGQCLIDCSKAGTSSATSCMSVCTLQTQACYRQRCGVEPPQ